MPDVRDPGRGDGRASRARWAAMAVVVVALIVACDGGSQSGEAPLSPPASSVPVTAMATIRPGSTNPDGVTLCQHVETVEERLAALEAVELRLPNRVALDIELGKLQAAFGELQQADLTGPFEDQLETALTRLGHRLEELELAVEDFRTNSRPQQAVAHVETDALTLGSELGSFAILARC